MGKNKNFSLWSLLAENKLLVVFVYIIALLYALLGVVSPLLYGKIFDAGLPSGALEKLVFYAGIYLVSEIMWAILVYFQRVIFAKICYKIIYQLRCKCIEKFNQLPLSYYDNGDYGKHIVFIEDNCSEIGRYLQNLMMLISFSVIAVAFVIAGMFIQNWVIALIVIVSFGIYFLINFFLSKRFSKLCEISMGYFQEFHRSVKQSYDNIILEKINPFCKKLYNEKYTSVKNHKNQNYKIECLDSFMNSFLTLVTALVTFLIFIVGGYFYFQDLISVGIIISLINYFGSMKYPLADLFSHVISYNSVKPCIKNLSGLFALEEETGSDTELNAPEIKAENIAFQYNKESPVLFNGFNLHIKENGLYGFLGASGCGKSTFLSLLLGFYKVNSGKIEMFGKDVNVLDKRTLRNSISYVSQDIELLGISLYENITMGDETITREEVESMLKKLDLEELISSLDNGIDTVMTDKVNLSGGQKRRISLARGLLKKAKIFLFDEPEAFLPSGFSDSLSEIFSELGKENIVLVSTHTPAILSNATKVINF